MILLSQMRCIGSVGKEIVVGGEVGCQGVEAAADWPSAAWLSLSMDTAGCFLYVVLNEVVEGSLWLSYHLRIQYWQDSDCSLLCLFEQLCKAA